MWEWCVWAAGQMDAQIDRERGRLVFFLVWDRKLFKCVFEKERGSGVTFGGSRESCDRQPEAKTRKKRMEGGWGGGGLAERVSPGLLVSSVITSISHSQSSQSRGGLESPGAGSGWTQGRCPAAVSLIQHHHPKVHHSVRWIIQDLVKCSCFI